MITRGGGGRGRSLGEWEHNILIKFCNLKGDTVCDHK